MVSAVRPSSNCSRAALISDSDSASGAEVGSSSSTGASLRKARAMAMRCFCPPEIRTLPAPPPRQEPRPRRWNLRSGFRAARGLAQDRSGQMPTPYALAATPSAPGTGREQGIDPRRRLAGRFMQPAVRWEGGVKFLFQFRTRRVAP
jgi:hypothetical protein